MQDILHNLQKRSIKGNVMSPKPQTNKKMVVLTCLSQFSPEHSHYLSSFEVILTNKLDESLAILFSNVVIYLDFIQNNRLEFAINILD